MFGFLVGKVAPKTRLRVFDQSAPQLVGPDNTPRMSDVLSHPYVRFYDPNMIEQRYHAPVNPGFVVGANGFGADCARQPQAMWDRGKDGGHTKQFFQMVMGSTGLNHL